MGPQPPIDRTLFAFFLKRQSSLASFCSSSQRHSSGKAFFFGATSHFAYHPDPRPPRARVTPMGRLSMRSGSDSPFSQNSQREREPFHPKVCVYRIFPSLKGKRRRTEMAASPSLSLLPGKCDSFLLEGSRVRKGKREGRTTACSKRLQCGGRNSRQAWGRVPRFCASWREIPPELDAFAFQL